MYPSLHRTFAYLPLIFALFIGLTVVIILPHVSILVTAISHLIEAFNSFLGRPSERMSDRTQCRRLMSGSVTQSFLVSRSYCYVRIQTFFWLSFLLLRQIGAISSCLNCALSVGFHNFLIFGVPARTVRQFAIRRVAGGYSRKDGGQH